MGNQFKPRDTVSPNTELDQTTASADSEPTHLKVGGSKFIEPVAGALEFAKLQPGPSQVLSPEHISPSAPCAITSAQQHREVARWEATEP